MDVSIDFETRSLVPIKHGAWRYAEDDSTDILCLAYHLPGADGPLLWWPDNAFPQALAEHVKSGGEIRAWNVEFELAVWTRILVPRFGAPPLKFSQLLDTQAEAAAMSLPQDLAGAGAALGVAEKHLKDPEGKRLIQYLCKPYRGKLREDPERLVRLGAYCMQDVKAEMAIARKLRRLDPAELLLFRRNLQMNYRGLPVDLGRAERMRRRYHKLRKAAVEECVELCGVKPTQVEQFTQLCGLPNMQKKTVERAIEAEETTSEVRHLLTLRQVASSTSLAKLDKLPQLTCKDGRMRGLFKYHGASTGRWVSQGGFNAQNLPRGEFETTAQYDQVLGDIEGAKVRELVSVLRSVFAFPMSVCDYSQIETRMLLWLADDHAGLAEFRQGLDPYKTMAARLYRVAYDDVTKPQRQIGKSAVLGAGYQLGWRGYISYADGMDIQVDQYEAERVIDAFRSKYAAVTKAWKACQNAAVMAIRHPGATYVAAKTVFTVKQNYLWLILPSGRRICYRKPWLTPGREEWMGPQVNFYGRDRYTRKWSKQTTYGGSLFQSITQGSARDVMADAMLRMWHRGMDVRGTVHDEIVNAGHVLAQMTEIMLKLPTWCRDMPIEVDGWEGEYYRK
jgi:DNA polymerase